MLRIIGVERSEEPNCEFVLLQNQGSLKVTLRGHALVADKELLDSATEHALHVFTEAEDIPGGLFVMVKSGYGSPHWGHSSDGRPVYVTYMHRHTALWNTCHGPLHLLRPQHSFGKRPASVTAN